MGISSYFEVVAGTLLKGVHGHDSNLVCKSPAFLHVGDPVLEVHAPECGPSGSPLQLHHSQLAGDGTQGAFPHLQWSRPVGSPAKVVEFVIVVEDPDVPIPTACPHHALLYGIPGDVTEATHMEIEMAHPKGSPEAAKRKTRAGWKYVPNIYGTSYIGPRPPLGHVPHRYFFTVAALTEPLGVDKERGGKVTKAEVVKAMEQKIAAWGQWMGTFEHTWKTRGSAQ